MGSGQDIYGAHRAKITTVHNTHTVTEHDWANFSLFTQSRQESLFWCVKDLHLWIDLLRIVHSTLFQYLQKARQESLSHHLWNSNQIHSTQYLVSTGVHQESLSWCFKDLHHLWIDLLRLGHSTLFQYLQEARQRVIVLVFQGPSSPVDVKSSSLDTLSIIYRKPVKSLFKGLHHL